MTGASGHVIFGELLIEQQMNEREEEKCGALKQKQIWTKF